MLIEAFCKKGSCERWFMENLETPKECPTCKGVDVWWTNDEVECIQPLDYLEDEDE